MASTSEDFFAAIGAGDLDAVRSMLAEDPSLAGSRDAQGVSATLRARYRFDRPMLEAIVAAGPTFDVFDAAAAGDLDRIVAHVDEDPSLVASTSGDGFAPLHLAAFFGRHDAVRLLLARGADPDVVGKGWMTGTPLHAAASARHAEVVGTLLEAGANPDVRQSGGWTPLHSAAHNGDAATLELLLAAGADVQLVNDDGATVLSLAEGSGEAATIERVRRALEG
jgi:ankyrin repeat protein